MSQGETKRIIVPGDDLDHDALATAIKLGIELSKSSTNEIDDVILFVPSKAQLQRTSLSAVIGDKIANILYKGESIPLEKHVTLRAETIKTFKRTSKKHVVIAVYIDSKMMDQLDGMPSLHTIIAVPHIDGALDNWVKTWSPDVYGENQSLENPIITDPIIVSALESLTSSINLSHTLLNPRDKEHTDTTIRILRRNKHSEDPSNVRAWAVKHGWHPKAADELENLWSKIFRLKNTPKVNDTEQAKRSYAYWVSKAIQ